MSVCPKTTTRRRRKLNYKKDYCKAFCVTRKRNYFLLISFSLQIVKSFLFFLLILILSISRTSISICLKFWSQASLILQFARKLPWLYQNKFLNWSECRNMSFFTIERKNNSLNFYSPRDIRRIYNLSLVWTIVGIYTSSTN